MGKFYRIGANDSTGAVPQVHFTVTGIYSMLKDIALHTLFEFRILLKTFLINTCFFGSTVE